MLSVICFYKILISVYILFVIFFIFLEIWVYYLTYTFPLIELTLVMSFSTTLIQLIQVNGGIFLPL